MKNLFLLVLLSFSSTAFAQVFVDKVNINDHKIQYLEVWEKYNKDSDRFFAMIDYGQQDNREDKAGTQLMVSSNAGQALEFNGIVNILNFMHSNGWEVLHVKTVGDYESFIMHRRYSLTNQVNKETATKTKPSGS